MRGPHREKHLIDRIGWLRAAVLGANDGIISTASLIVGVAAGSGGARQILLTGIAGLVAGSMSMAAGEYVSVSSQADTERADLERERRELEDHPDGELEELSQIYIERGLDPDLAFKVATQLMRTDALGAHARDELGISAAISANPVQAAVTSALTFASGAAVPILVAVLAPQRMLVASVFTASLLLLAVLGAVSAKTGGAGLLKGTVRVAFWGALAMAATAGIGHLFGTAV